MLKQLPAEAGNRFYAGNRAPLVPSPLIKLPVGAVKPQGWLRKQLELMADGFTGRLHELSRFLDEQGNAWLSPTGEGDKSFWEEVPYWLKGYGDLGYLLNDQRIITEARRWIEAAIASQREDGYFGPRRNLAGGPNPKLKKPDLWPNMIMLNVLQSYYEFSGDERVLKLMDRYFRWELGIPEEDFLPPFWQQQRASDNLASVYWLYNITGEPWLLELGTKIHKHTANWTDGVASWHGVNISQSFRAPGVYYEQSRDPKFLEAVERNYRTVREMYGQVPGGLYGADENCRPGFTDPRQAAETCTMVEMMLSDGMMLRITGELAWADRCEDVAFNSLPASMTADLKALRYLTAPNMVLSDRKSKAPGLQNSGAMLLFDPRSHRCCQHNVSHGWPYFTENLWMAAPANGLAAVMYAPCSVTAKVGDGTAVTLQEDTRYPFDETVALTVSSPRKVRFPLYLRVPGWCDAPELAINGKPVAATAEPLSYLALDREWSDGDKVLLRLPMKVRLTRWEKNKNCVSVNRGPLTYSIKIGENYVRAGGPSTGSGPPRAESKGGDDKWPALEVYPTTPWNYGLVLNDKDPAASFTVKTKAWPKNDQPFETESSPIELRAQARKIPEWKMDYLGLVGPLTESPIKSDEPVETVSMIPMGCGRLRIASIPTIGGPDAHEWQAPQTSPPHTASHCCPSDTVMALSDGKVPKSSNDHSIPRFTWWPHRGTSEWVTYEFPKLRKVSKVEVYWFDDTGQGHCRVPESWRLEWLDGKDWKPVTGASDYGTKPDQFNNVSFDAATTTALRIVVELQPDFSGGILEWRVVE